MRKILIIILAVVVSLSSCKKFLEVEADESQVLAETVFESDANAVSALRGLYVNIISSVLAGGSEGMAAIAGLSADELDNVLDQLPFFSFERNNIEAENSIIDQQWTAQYATIYQCNDLIESVAGSPNLSGTIKNRITGEALFIRAYYHFYLANLFGDIPIVTGTDYRANSRATRKPVTEVYTQIVTDLTKAAELLTDEYPEAQRARVNGAAVQALLSRVYLYQKKWDLTVAAATKVMATGGLALEADLNNVFLPASAETIWQLVSLDGRNTRDAIAFRYNGQIENSTMTLRVSLAESFDVADKRRTDWVHTETDPGSGSTLYFANKYKANGLGPVTIEHTVMLRLAEQYLNRAEAYAELNQLSLAIEDLDLIRGRAGLLLIANINLGISQSDLITLIREERRHELFTEQGHRWLDLKRWELAQTVIGAIKPTFQPTDVLFPLPLAEMQRNPFLTPQNLGY